MQGGHHPDLGIEYYEDLFTSIKARYPIHLHALSPPEVQHIARRSKLTIPETLARLRDAGLDSLPGRRRGDPRRPRADDHRAEEDEVRRVARRDAPRASTRHVDDGHDDVRARRDGLRARRAHAAGPRAAGRDGGFRAFISWTFQDDGNRLGALVPRETMPTSFDYLLTQAVSRIYLDNVDHIQSSWVTQGMKIGQVALGFGADDMGSVMIEENVVSAAGTTHRTSIDELVRRSSSLGKIPVQRDTLYRRCASSNPASSIPLAERRRKLRCAGFAGARAHPEADCRLRRRPTSGRRLLSRSCKSQLAPSASSRAPRPGVRNPWDPDGGRGLHYPRPGSMRRLVVTLLVSLAAVALLAPAGHAAPREPGPASPTRTRAVHAARPGSDQRAPRAPPRRADDAGAGASRTTRSSAARP